MAPWAVGWGQAEGLWEKTDGVQCQAHLDTVWRQEDRLGTGLYDAEPGRQAGDFLVLTTQAERAEARRGSHWSDAGNSSENRAGRPRETWGRKDVPWSIS